MAAAGLPLLQPRPNAPPPPNPRFPRPWPPRCAPLAEVGAGGQRVLVNRLGQHRHHHGVALVQQHRGGGGGQSRRDAHQLRGQRRHARGGRALRLSCRKAQRGRDGERGVRRCRCVPRGDGRREATRLSGLSPVLLHSKPHGRYSLGLGQHPTYISQPLRESVVTAGEQSLAPEMMGPHLPWRAHPPAPSRRRPPWHQAAP